MKFYNELFVWLDEIAKIYQREILKPRVDITRFLSDRDYAVKKFILYWGFERQGAPLSFKVAAIKSITDQGITNSNYSGIYNSYYSKKKNVRNNPGFDERIIKLNFCEIAQLIVDGRVEEAYFKLQLNGIGHKIKTFLIRDIISLAGSESSLNNDIDKLIFTQPVDIWIEYFMKNIKLNQLPCSRYKAGAIGTYPKTLKYGLTAIKLSRDVNVSPINVSQAMWFFCSRIVADENRIVKLFESQDIDKFKKELDMVGEYIVN